MSYRNNFIVSLVALVLTACTPTADPAATSVKGVPANLTAMQAEFDTAIVLEWDSVEGATGYRVYRATNQFSSIHPMLAKAMPARTFKVLNESDAAASLGDTSRRFYKDDAVTAATTYFYRVTALFDDGARESEPSDIASAEAGASGNLVPMPSAPPIITMQNVQGSTVIKPGDGDADDTHLYTVSHEATSGLVYVTPGGIAVYVPNAGYFGNDRFQVTVIDSKGAQATLSIFVAVQHPDVYSGGTADINTFKNVAAGYVVVPKNADADTAQFSIATAPAHGTATISGGILVYTPALQYTGADSVEVNDGAASHVLSISVRNRAPQPTAASITVDINASGQSQILHGDPDPSDPHGYSVVTAATLGNASVSASGLLTYTATSAFGEDEVVVRVTDGSGAFADMTIAIAINLFGVTPGGGGEPLPVAACGDGVDRVLITAIDPLPGTSFPANTTFTVTATLSYSVATTASIGMGDYSTTVTEVTVEPGCGSVIVSADFNLPGGQDLQLHAVPNDALQRIQFVTTGYNAPTFDIVGLSLPLGSYIDSATYEIFATQAFDYASILGILYGYETVGLGDMDSGSALITTLKPISGRTVRLRGALACDGRFATFEFMSMDYPAYLDYDTISYAAKPPVLTVNKFLTGIPVTAATDYTEAIGISSCSGALPVTIETSAAWFSVDNTQPVVNTTATVNLTVHGDAIVTAGSEVTGFLTFRYAGGAVTVPVSAIRHDLDLGDYEEYTDPIELPWEVPFRGVGYPYLQVEDSGALYLSTDNAGDCYGYVWLGNTTIVPPSTCPLLAALNSNVVGDLSTDPIYWRAVTEGTNPHVEVLYWDLKSAAYAAHNVIRSYVYPDGRFTFEYLTVTAFGYEHVGWYDMSGISGPIVFPAQLRNGDVLNFGPVE